MATVTLSAPTNYSVVEPSLSNGDTIALNGFALTFDKSPALNALFVTAAGNSGTIVLGTPASFTFTGCDFQAGGVALMTAVANKSINGGTFRGGTGINAAGLSIVFVSGFSVSNAAGYAGSATGAHGINNQNTGMTNCAGYAGNTSGVHGINGGTIASGDYINCTGIGGGTSGSHGINVAGVRLISCTGTGGSASGSYGLAVSSVGYVFSPTLTTTVSGAYGLSNSGVAVRSSMRR